MEHGEVKRWDMVTLLCSLFLILRLSAIDDFV